MLKLSPSVLSADFGHLAEDIQIIDQAGSEYIHLDVMDGSLCRIFHLEHRLSRVFVRYLIRCLMFIL